MSENQQGLPQPDVSGAERLRNSILQRAASFMRSTQNPPEWPGAQFIKPKDTHVFSEVDARFGQILTEFALDTQGGVMVDGISLGRAVFDHSNDPIADDAKKAQERGFWAGATEALDWMGITRDKWSSQPADICALEALAAAEGLPTSRQSNHMRPESLVGAKVKILLESKVLNMVQPMEFLEVIKVRTTWVWLNGNFKVN
jgi:hypothetical protein